MAGVAIAEGCAGDGLEHFGIDWEAGAGLSTGRALRRHEWKDALYSAGWGALGLAGPTLRIIGTTPFALMGSASFEYKNEQAWGDFGSRFLAYLAGTASGYAAEHGIQAGLNKLYDSGLVLTATFDNYHDADIASEHVRKLMDDELGIRPNRCEYSLETPYMGETPFTVHARFVYDSHALFPDVEGQKGKPEIKLDQKVTDDMNSYGAMKVTTTHFTRSPNDF